MEKRRLLLFWKKIAKGEPNACWEWTAAKSEKGYGFFHNGHRLVRAHRLSYELTNGPIARGMLVCHRCDNPACVNPAHLFVGTVRDNTIDMLNKGRAQRGWRVGENSHRAKITEVAVLDIRSKRLGRREFAALYRIARDTVRDIQRRRCWRHL